MVKLQFNKEKGEWIKLPDNSEDGIYLDGYLLNKLQNVKKIIKKDFDAVILIDGKERIGKSTLAMTIGWYLSNETITHHNICTGMADAINKIKNLPDKSILIIDEGSLVFNSKDVMKTEQKKLMKILDVVGQKNLTVIICLPSFFDLAKSIAVRRSLFLLHVFKNEDWDRGGFAYYGEEQKPYLYERGKKNFGKYACEPEFYGRFTEFKSPFHKEYLELKKKSLIESLNDEKKEVKINESKLKTDFMLKFKENCPEIPIETIAKGFGTSDRSFYRRIKHRKALTTATKQ